MKRTVFSSLVLVVSINFLHISHSFAQADVNVITFLEAVGELCGGTTTQSVQALGDSVSFKSTEVTVNPGTGSVFIQKDGVLLAEMDGEMGEGYYNCVRDLTGRLDGAWQGEVMSKSELDIDCDGQTHDPYNLDNPNAASGVPISEVEASSIEICKAAWLNSRSLRHKFQWARALESIDEDTEASRLYQETCAAGYQYACYAHGKLILDSSPVDPRTTLRGQQILERACNEFEIGPACRRVGHHYYNYVGLTDVDEDKGRRYFERACVLGHGPACNDHAMYAIFPMDHLFFAEEHISKNNLPIARSSAKRGCALDDQASCSTVHALRYLFDGRSKHEFDAVLQYCVEGITHACGWASDLVYSIPEEYGGGEELIEEVKGQSCKLEPWTCCTGSIVACLNSSNTEK